MPAFDAERAVLILLDALVMGDRRAAEKWQVADRTIENYRARLRTDVGFAAFFAARKAAAAGDWGLVRLRFLRKGIAKLEALVDGADSPDHIRDVADAIKVVGELQIASDALGVGDPTDQSGSGPTEDPGSAPEGGQEVATTLQ